MQLDFKVDIKNLSDEQFIIFIDNLSKKYCEIYNTFDLREFWKYVDTIPEIKEREFLFNYRWCPKAGFNRGEDSVTREIV